MVIRESLESLTGLSVVVFPPLDVAGLGYLNRSVAVGPADFALPLMLFLPCKNRQLSKDHQMSSL